LANSAIGIEFEVFVTLAIQKSARKPAQMPEITLLYVKTKIRKIRKTLVIDLL